MEKLLLYNGDVVIYFDEVKHKFYHEDMSPITNSVTGFTGIRDKSGPLIGWAVKMMGLYLVDNWNVNKVTKESQKIELIDTAKREFRRIKEEARDIGTDIHEWIKDWIAGKKPVMSEDERTVNGITAFLKFQKERNIEWVASERKVYSVKYDYGGILDGIGIINSKLELCDFKSAKGIYDEAIFQTTGYRLAIEEELEYLIRIPIAKIKDPKDKVLLKAYKKYKGFSSNRIIQFGKLDGEFNTLTFNEYEKDKEAFLACRTLKIRTDELKKVLKQC